ncbi:crossover junction endodeoxyribonuclease RuvC [Psittacicella gerlachiana]|uniref:Crossover junction endodeoxyribonuclease RuvC n=1 Tax=Psittacicella gerlachiana TaxID=2028574 RepID=A0A3A1YNM7_9GAMM|nr:crossover junction endodeoxyribonuclease RuvC [Psittacicella gerlachiana]RIY37884.1 crossover junction endodeoxyribonuclease RuvC [Psittacicella gerlachiana]
MTIILGLDPGSVNMGYGIIEKTGSKLKYITSGVISVKGSDINSRLPIIYAQLQEVIKTYQPEHMVVEQVFIATNPQAAIKLGMARGIAILAGSLGGATIFELSARQAKKFVTGIGSAKKEQVNHMVCRILHLTSKPKLDASDALALAISHAHTLNSRVMLQKQQEQQELFDQRTQQRLINSSLNFDSLARAFAQQGEGGETAQVLANLTQQTHLSTEKETTIPVNRVQSQVSKIQAEFVNIKINSGRFKVKSGKASNRAKLEAKIKNLLEQKHKKT